jgi:hypothetical protein
MFSREPILVAPLEIHEFGVRLSRLTEIYLVKWVSKTGQCVIGDSLRLILATVWSALKPLIQRMSIP